MSSLSLFLLFAKIGFFTFGGGYAMIPLFQQELVTVRQLLTPAEFADLIAMAQMTPGPVGLNAATYIGMQQNGLSGALAGTLGITLPSLTLTLLVAVCLRLFRHSALLQSLLAGIRPVIAGLLVSAVLFFFHAACWSAGKFLYQGLLIYLLILGIACLPLQKKPSHLWLLLLGALLGLLLP